MRRFTAKTNYYERFLSQTNLSEANRIFFGFGNDFNLDLEKIRTRNTKLSHAHFFLTEFEMIKFIVQPNDTSIHSSIR